MDLIEQAQNALALLGFDGARRGERSALTLLGLLGLHPGDSWANATQDLHSIRSLMDYMSEYFGRHCSPNIRETIRREILQQFTEAALVVLNPDDPSRAVNCPSRVYQVEDQAFTLLRQFQTPQWERSLSAYLEHRAQRLAAYAELYRWESKRAVQERSVSVPEREAQSTCHKHGRDLFICHASEDKGSVARPLADILISHGLTVWLDELELSVGDSLNSRIEAALTHSCFGVVVLSPAFFAKEWPKRELSGLVAREVATGAKVILAVKRKAAYLPG